MSNVGSVPNPDPTQRTIEQLQREISSVEKHLLTVTTGARDVIETRLAGMDKAIELLEGRSQRLPDQILDAVRQLQSLHEEKFRSIETQFIERDTRTEQTSRDSKVAVDAALQAAKEAVGEQNKSNALAIAKSEATFTKQIDQIGVLISTMQKGIDDKIDDIKSRLQVIEGQRAGGHQVWGYVIAALGLIIGAAAIAASVLFRVVLK